MDTERNLLFGILARHVRLIDDRTLIETLKLWSTDQTRSFAELLTECCRIEPSGREQVGRLLDELVAERDNNVENALSDALNELATDAKADIRQTIVTILGTQKTLIQPDSAKSEAANSASTYFPYLVKQPLPQGARYTRSSLHAAGGMGSVWLAHDANVGRDVALKELRAECAVSTSVPLRFLREAQITGQLEHPGVVPVYEIGRDPTTGWPFYTMRFVRGRTLTDATHTFHEHRKTGHDEPLEFVNLLSAFVSVCHTIAYAHSHGIVHRDLKGENVVLGDFGEVIVLDWGLAKRLKHAEDDEAPFGGSGLPGAGLFDAVNTSLPPMSLPDSALPDDAGKTLMGQVMGTPAYMAPEQANGRLDLVGPCTDIFGAGAILYEILTGRPPFDGITTQEVLQQAQRGDIVAPRELWPDVPPALEAICLRALSREPTDRHFSASELAWEVQGWQDKQRRQAEEELRQAGERLMRQQAALVKLTRSEVFSALDLSQIFCQMSEVSARILEVERVGVWLYTDDRCAIRCHLLYERSADRTSSGTELRADDFPSYFKALKTSEVLPAHDACEDPRTREFTESYLIPLGIGAILDAPLHVCGQMRGVVCHEHVGPPRKWTPDEQLFAIAIANLVSQAIGQWDQRQTDTGNPTDA